ncbi:uncharacterized protein LOC132701317 isoform X1 [Cylas formicarius]|uniref:uncharacterized protein LOC132701317 isoform X1 n=1 Tax=Cylas formicarius TaxID=197179 RepID=UPI0029583AF1|nr:uncharacterized protein LOC132701317 isoform X1 [Cylas formicarius]
MSVVGTCPIVYFITCVLLKYFAKDFSQIFDAKQAIQKNFYQVLYIQFCLAFSRVGSFLKPINGVKLFRLLLQEMLETHYDKYGHKFYTYPEYSKMYYDYGIKGPHLFCEPARIRYLYNCYWPEGARNFVSADAKIRRSLLRSQMTAWRQLF